MSSRIFGLLLFLLFLPFSAFVVSLEQIGFEETKISWKWALIVICCVIFSFVCLFLYIK